MSQPLHTITTLQTSNTFLDYFLRLNDTIAVVNAIKIYDVAATGGIIHKRQVSPSTQEVLQLNIASTGGGAFGYGLGLISLANPSDLWEGATYAVRLNYGGLQQASSFVGISGVTTFVDDFDIVSIGASGSRGDGTLRPLKVFAKDSIPPNIDGAHRFRGDIFFDGSQVVINSAQLHLDDRLIFLASAGNTDSPGATAGLTSNSILAGGCGSGFVIKGASGDKWFAYRTTDSGLTYVSFQSSEYINSLKGYVSSNGQFNFIGVSGNAPSISLRTSGQDSASIPIGWKIYQSATGADVGTLKIRREGMTDFDALELFADSQVKIGTISNGTGGDGSFKTEAAKFSVPSTREKQVLHYSWQNRDIVELKGTTEGGLFAESTSSFKPGTVLTYNNLGQYKRARWDASPFDGYKDAEVVGILEKITTDDFLLQVPVISGRGATYTTSLFSVNENVTIQGNGFTVRGYVYDSLPSSGLSGIKIFVDNFPTGISAGSFVKNTGSIFVGGATLFGSADNDFIGISAAIGITVTNVNYGVIVRQGLFEIPDNVVGATGYESISNLGLSAGWLFYLGGTFSGNKTNSYGGVTYSPNNLFDPQIFYNCGANVAKPLFIYLGLIDGKRMGMFNHYQGLGLTYSITTPDMQPIYYDNDTQEIQNFEIIGQASGRNKILNSGFDLWTRLDAAGTSYSGFDSGISRGITFGETKRSFYPFGVTYNGLPASYNDNTLISSYIADGYFFDTLNRSRGVLVRRQPISTSLPTGMAYPPNYELRITQVTGGVTSGRPRLYSIVPNHKTLPEHDFNFSFYARSDSPTTVGISAGVAFVWNNGATYAIIESKHAFLSSGSGTPGVSSGVSGGKSYITNLTNTYQRFHFAFSSESLSYSGATGDTSSFIAPFIEMGSTLPNGNSIYLTGLQLSKGIAPKPYEKRSVSQEKLECDRFFQNIVLANGGYYPIFTGNSGPKIFAVSNIQTPLAETPTVINALDITSSGIIGVSAFGDPLNVRKNSISVQRTTDTVSSSYHRYFESVYCLDASGFSGSISKRLLGLT